MIDINASNKITMYNAKQCHQYRQINTHPYLTTVGTHCCQGQGSEYTHRCAGSDV